jgi:hypothetical protein
MARSERFELPTLGFEVIYVLNEINQLAAPCCNGVAMVLLLLLSEQSDLNILGGALICIAIGEQMAVHVERHLDRAVPHEILDALGVHAVLNPQGSAGVA